jgi:hypothetical protein
MILDEEIIKTRRLHLLFFQGLFIIATLENPLKDEILEQTPRNNQEYP